VLAENLVRLIGSSLSCDQRRAIPLDQY
jgi:hypothetical protein